MQCHGMPSSVIVGGRVVFENNALVTPSQPGGKFVQLTTHAPYVYSVIQQREKVRVTHVCAQIYACLAQVGVAQKIEREPYRPTGKESMTRPSPAAAAADHHTSARAQVRGVRNQFDSQLQLTNTGECRNDTLNRYKCAGGPDESKSQTKISQPPGGKSSGLW